MSYDDNAWDALVKVLGGAVLLTLGTLLCAWGVQTLWSWFVVPLGAPAIGMAHAYGLTLIAAVLCKDLGPKGSDADRMGALEKGLSAAITLLLLLGIGWVTHMFM